MEKIPDYKIKAEKVLRFSRLNIKVLDKKLKTLNIIKMKVP